jgi:alpha-galactosidase
MGWNSWNTFGCDVNEDKLKSAAAKVQEFGLDKLGYNYINVDDCWLLKERDAQGHVQVDPKNFPSGMKALADHMHGNGLKFGLYSSAGTYTCAGRAGGLDHEVIDAQDYADWGVDYLKYDNCFNQDRPALERYPAMRDALNATGRPIFYSICNWGEEETWKWAPETGNSWRISMDIFDSWESVESNFDGHGQNKAEIAGPGGWNDPDMLEIGNGGLTHEEERTHFALWSIMKAPLIIGADLSKISQSSLDIMKNEEIIAVN